MELTLMDPAVILYRGTMSDALCVEANGTGQNAQLWLKPVDPTGKTTAQLWQYGSDQRIYQYDGTATPAFCIGLAGPVQAPDALILVPASPTDKTQTWTLSTSAYSITNGPNKDYSMNDQGGKGNVKDFVIIFPNTPGTTNFLFAFAIYPNFPGQATN